ncbi:MAG: peptide-methionine (S)-S-oxide reductase MsrA [Lewinellaceae bacterium]|nr:peptide-methionine (S)-S-oxide reductase MsrA [Lewinellaceae bacterium]
MVKSLFLAGALGLALLACSSSSSPVANDAKLTRMTPSLDSIPADQVDTATLGGGCFWCVEAVLQQVEGIYSVVSGYSGGKAEEADYETVSSGLTHHAEVVQVYFDPRVISFADILEIFWSTHNPTTLNRQGNDVGPQYRSVIFYHNEAQKAIAEQSKKEVATQFWDGPIVTEISPFTGFWPAEEYHQNYYENVGDRNPYCTYIITPKVEKLKKLYKDKLKEEYRHE